MKKLLLAVVVLALALSGFCAYADDSELKVTGTGIVSLNADTATINLGVREVSGDVAEAQHTVNTRLAAVIDRLKEMGVAVDDIHTSSISIYPNYDYENSDGGITSYIAENTISVKTTDLENAGALIDAAFEAGANVFTDIYFSAADTREENCRALSLAVENAREKAEVLAGAANMKLGEIKSIEEMGYGYSDNGAAYAAKESADVGAAGTQVFANQLQVSASVTVEFELVPAE